MQLDDWLNIVASRKAIYTSPRGTELVDRATLAIMQDNDLPRLIEMVRVLAETMGTIQNNAVDDELVVTLTQQIEDHVDKLIEMDEFKEWKSKRTQ